jgi:hypothetical protein
LGEIDGSRTALAIAGSRDPAPPKVSTVKVKEPTQTVTEQDTDPGTLTVEETGDPDVEQIEATVTSVAGVDESSIDDVKVEGRPGHGDAGRRPPSLARERNGSGSRGMSSNRSRLAGERRRGLRPRRIAIKAAASFADAGRVSRPPDG